MLKVILLIWAVFILFGLRSLKEAVKRLKIAGIFLSVLFVASLVITKIDKVNLPFIEKISYGTDAIFAKPLLKYIESKKESREKFYKKMGWGQP